MVALTRAVVLKKSKKELERTPGICSIVTFLALRCNCFHRHRWYKSTNAFVGDAYYWKVLLSPGTYCWDVSLSCYRITSWSMIFLPTPCFLLPMDLLFSNGPFVHSLSRPWLKSPSIQWLSTFIVGWIWTTGFYLELIRQSICLLLLILNRFQNSPEAILLLLLFTADYLLLLGNTIINIERYKKINLFISLV